MGTRLTFKCKSCGYRVISSGGHDYGMFTVTQPFICKSCNNIVDVCVGENGQTYSMEEIILKKKEGASNLKFLTCPECGSGTNLVKWNEIRKPCPRCDGRMENDINGLVMEWD